MGHINHDDLRRMVQMGAVTGIDLDFESKPEFCAACVEGKSTRRPFPKKSESSDAKAYGDKVVTDIWGPAEEMSLGRHKYAVPFMDVATHEERPYFAANKSEHFARYKEYEAWVKQ